jgi:hypothetical protein
VIGYTQLPAAAVAIDAASTFNSPPPSRTRSPRSRSLCNDRTRTVGIEFHGGRGNLSDRGRCTQRLSAVLRSRGSWSAKPGRSTLADPRLRQAMPVPAGAVRPRARWWLVRRCSDRPLEALWSTGGRSAPRALQPHAVSPVGQIGCGRTRSKPLQADQCACGSGRHHHELPAVATRAHSIPGARRPARRAPAARRRAPTDGEGVLRVRGACAAADGLEIALGGFPVGIASGGARIAMQAASSRASRWALVPARSSAGSRSRRERAASRAPPLRSRGTLARSEPHQTSSYLRHRPRPHSPWVSTRTH